MKFKYPDYLPLELDKPTTEGSFDYMIRLAGTNEDDMNYVVKETHEFKTYLSNIFEYFKFVKDTLVEVILSQKKLLDYNGVYNAFLLDQLSEEEFEQEAKTFIYKPASIDPKKLSIKIEILYNYTKIDYSTSELSNIFHCDIDNVEESIKIITNKINHE